MQLNAEFSQILSPVSNLNEELSLGEYGKLSLFSLTQTSQLIPHCPKYSQIPFFNSWGGKASRHHNLTEARSCVAQSKNVHPVCLTKMKAQQNTIRWSREQGFSKGHITDQQKQCRCFFATLDLKRYICDSDGAPKLFQKLLTHARWIEEAQLWVTDKKAGIKNSSHNTNGWRSFPSFQTSTIQNGQMRHQGHCLWPKSSGN